MSAAAPSIMPDAVDDPRPRILLVCLGNICRSPTAEVVLRSRAAARGVADQVVVDSAGTGDWHAGMPPDRRAIAHAAKRGYDLTPLRARQVTPDDFQRFNWILAMDRSVLRELTSLQPAQFSGRIGRFLDFAPHVGLRDVPDPYYGGASHFERVLDLVEHASDGLLTHLFERPHTG